MTIGPFWRYYGGKWRAAPRYPQPECGTIIEPFAGAAGYSCRYPSHRVILVDASPIICGIWRYLISVSPAEVLALPDIPEGGTVDDLEVCQEARWLAGFWAQEGVAHPRKSVSSWAATENRQGSGSWGGWSPRARARIAREVGRIRHWKVIAGNYTAAPNVEATGMIDPPYQTKAGREYRHQVSSYAALGEWCQSRRGQVIACDQEGSDWMPWNRRISLRACTRTEGKTKSDEVYYHRSIHPTLFGAA